MEHGSRNWDAGGIAHVTGPENFFSVRERAGAYRALAGARDPGPVRRLVRRLGPRGGRPALEARRRKPDALFCGNDQIARGAVDALRERGIDVPERRLGRRLRQLGDRRRADAPAADHRRHEPEGARPAGRTDRAGAGGGQVRRARRAQAAVPAGGPAILRGRTPRIDKENGRKATRILGGMHMMRKRLLRSDRVRRAQPGADRCRRPKTSRCGCAPASATPSSKLVEGLQRRSREQDRADRSAVLRAGAEIRNRRSPAARRPTHCRSTSSTPRPSRRPTSSRT